MTSVHSEEPRGLFVGLATMDLVYEVEAFPEANHKMSARSQQLYVGGPATNAAITFAGLRGHAALAAAVGAHPLSAVIRAELEAYRVALIDLHPCFEDLPVLSSVAVDPVGQRTVVSANAGRMIAPPSQPDVELCRWAQIVEVDGHQMEACQRWAAAARAQGAHIVLDAGSWKLGTEELLRHVDTVLCSADFHPPGCRTRGAQADDDTVAWLAAAGVGQIAITHGAEAVRWQRGAEGGLVEVLQVEAVDTMGAGDIFHGVFCSVYARGAGFVAAVDEAAQVASHACRFAGPRAWLHA